MLGRRNVFCCFCIFFLIFEGKIILHSFFLTLFVAATKIWGKQKKTIKRKAKRDVNCFDIFCHISDIRRKLKLSCSKSHHFAFRSLQIRQHEISDKSITTIWIVCYILLLQVLPIFQPREKLVLATIAKNLQKGIQDKSCSVFLTFSAADSVP